MKKTTIGQIENAVSGRLTAGDRQDVVSGVSTDSRAIGKGDVFFPLTGARYNAHDFIHEAVDNGAKCVIVSEDRDIPQKPDLNIIKVGDTTKALQDLAKWHASESGIKKIGITGSTGKTTTKDMLYHICAEKYKTGKTAGNFNNEIGLPLTLLSFDEDVEVGVIEMGVEVIGEMHMLADIARPDIAIMTNIGLAHIASFGSRENILKGKLEITDFFNESSLLVVNGDNDLLTKGNVSGGYRLALIGSGGENDFILGNIDDLGEDGVEFTLTYKGESGKYKLTVPGRHNAYNASLAIAAAMDLGISKEEAARGLLKVSLTGNRLRVEEKNGIKIIDDTYNAGPDSMRAAIDFLSKAKGERKIAVIGDMLELGESSIYHHERIGEYAAGKNFDLLMFTGVQTEYAARKAAEIVGNENVIYHKDRQALEEVIMTYLRRGDVVLVKGSRGMAMEHIVQRIPE